MNDQKKISIVIPNYNGEIYLRDCLESVRRQEGADPVVIVVDNGSTDGSVALLEKEYPEVRLIRFDTNTGFCGAVNAGIKASDGMDYVILLNNDTVIDPHFTRALSDAMTLDEKIFSAQAKMLSMRDHSIMDDAGNYYCALGWAFARGKGKKDRPAYNEKKEIFSSCAGAAIYRKSVLDEIGLFDENHFAYLEDTDIGWRAKIYGYKNIYAPSAVVYHVGSATSGSVYNLFKVKNSSRNSVYIIGKNMPILQKIINLPFLIPGFLVKSLFFAKKGWGKEYIKGIRKGVTLSRQGKKEGKKVKFEMKNLPHYFGIQLSLWASIGRRVKEFLG